MKSLMISDNWTAVESSNRLSGRLFKPRPFSDLVPYNQLSAGQTALSSPVRYFARSVQLYLIVGHAAQASRSAYVSDG